MPISKEQKLMELLGEHEEALSDLYRAYARSFPEYREFWLQLAGDELHHASWLAKIVEEIRADIVALEIERPTIPAVTQSISMIVDEVTKACEEGVSLRHALNISIGIEDAMIEECFFELLNHYYEDNQKLPENLLRGSTVKHSKVLKNTLHEATLAGY